MFPNKYRELSADEERAIIFSFSKKVFELAERNFKSRPVVQVH
jgi:hypothetical protein